MNILFDSSNGLHRDVKYHPEQPLRIIACLYKLLTNIQPEDGNLLFHDVATEPVPLVEIGDIETQHSPFRKEEISHARDMLLEAHTPDLVIKLEENTKASIQRRIEEGKSALGHMGYIDHDTYITTASLDVCLRATAAWIRATDQAMEKGSAMALMRPPGHHATSSGSNGFCLFNFAAAAALHVVLRDKSARVSILDWDIHYGQGVADIVQRYPNIRYASIHQRQSFPYMGESLSVLGPHANVFTIPIQPETTWTCGYKEAYERALDFCVQPGEWEPDVVIVGAGYDALSSDELASCNLIAEDYATMTHLLFDKLSQSSRKKPAVMIGLEGGYQLDKMAGGGGLGDAVAATSKAILERKELIRSDGDTNTIRQSTTESSP